MHCKDTNYLSGLQILTIDLEAFYQQNRSIRAARGIHSLSWLPTVHSGTFRRCVCYAVTVVTVVTVLSKGIPTPKLVLYIIYIIIYIIYRYKLSLFTNRFWNCNNCNTVTLSEKIILSFLNKVDSKNKFPICYSKILHSRFLLLFLQT